MTKYRLYDEQDERASSSVASLPLKDRFVLDEDAEPSSSMMQLRGNSRRAAIGECLDSILNGLERSTRWVLGIQDSIIDPVYCTICKFTVKLALTAKSRAKQSWTLAMPSRPCLP